MAHFSLTPSKTDNIRSVQRVQETKKRRRSSSSSSTTTTTASSPEPLKYTAEWYQKYGTPEQQATIIPEKPPEPAPVPEEPKSTALVLDASLSPDQIKDTSTKEFKTITSETQIKETVSPGVSPSTVQSAITEKTTHVSPTTAPTPEGAPQPQPRSLFVKKQFPQQQETQSRSTLIQKNYSSESGAARLPNLGYELTSDTLTHSTTQDEKTAGQRASELKYAQDIKREQLKEVVENKKAGLVDVLTSAGIGGLASGFVGYAVGGPPGAALGFKYGAAVGGGSRAAYYKSLERNYEKNPLTAELTAGITELFTGAAIYGASSKLATATLKTADKQAVTTADIDVSARKIGKGRLKGVFGGKTKTRVKINGVTVGGTHEDDFVMGFVSQSDDTASMTVGRGRVGDVKTGFERATRQVSKLERDGITGFKDLGATRTPDAKAVDITQTLIKDQGVLPGVPGKSSDSQLYSMFSSSRSQSIGKFGKIDNAIFSKGQIGIRASDAKAAEKGFKMFNFGSKAKGDTITKLTGADKEILKQILGDKVGTIAKGATDKAVGKVVSSITGSIGAGGAGIKEFVGGSTKTQGSKAKSDTPRLKTPQRTDVNNLLAAAPPKQGNGAVSNPFNLYTKAGGKSKLTEPKPKQDGGGFSEYKPKITPLGDISQFKGGLEKIVPGAVTPRIDFKGGQDHGQDYWRDGMTKTVDYTDSDFKPGTRKKTKSGITNKDGEKYYKITGIWEGQKPKEKRRIIDAPMSKDIPKQRDQTSIITDIINPVKPDDTPKTGTKSGTKQHFNDGHVGSPGGNVPIPPFKLPSFGFGGSPGKTRKSKQYVKTFHVTDIFKAYSTPKQQKSKKKKGDLFEF